MENINIDRQQVQSSNIKSIGYDAENKVLEVEFLPRQAGNTETNVARYNTVPANVWDEFRTAASIGKYYHNNIKGRFPVVRPVNN